MIRSFIRRAAPVCSNCRSTPITPQIYRICSFRALSAEASAAKEDSKPTILPEEVEFKSEKARDLFLRITSTLSRNDAVLLGEEVGRQLGRFMRQNEFYYRGFGGAGGGRVAGGAVGSGAGEEAATEEKTTVDLKLTGFDDKAKIKVIKEIRAIAGLGLKESKELVEAAPSIIQKDIKPEAAEELKAKLEELGATVELV